MNQSNHLPDGKTDLIIVIAIPAIKAKSTIPFFLKKEVKGYVSSAAEMFAAASPTSLEESANVWNIIIKKIITKNKLLAKFELIFAIIKIS